MSQTLDDKGQGLSLTTNNTESNALDQHVTKLVEPAIASSLPQMYEDFLSETVNHLTDLICKVLNVMYKVEYVEVLHSFEMRI